MKKYSRATVWNFSQKINNKNVNVFYLNFEKFPFYVEYK